MERVVHLRSKYGRTTPTKIKEYADENSLTRRAGVYLPPKQPQTEAKPSVDDKRFIYQPVGIDVLDDPCEQPPTEPNRSVEIKGESLNQSLPLEGGGPLAVEGVKTPPTETNPPEISTLRLDLRVILEGREESRGATPLEDDTGGEKLQ